MTMSTVDSTLASLRPWRVVAGVCLACVAMPMTFTGPAVALRDIAHSLGGSPVALAWVTNAFMLAFGSFLMMAGALADRHGRRRVFLGGLVAFVLTSVALMVAPNLLAFNLLRAAQGAASAAVFAGGAAAMAQEFEGAARLRAFSILGTSFGLGLTLGPVAAGWLTSGFGWRFIFASVVALVCMALLIAAPILRESRDPQAQALDWPGAATFTLALGLFTCGVLQAPESGWTHPGTLAALVGSIVLMAAFVRIERRAVRPMLDLTLFRYPRFVGVQLLAAAPAYGFVVLLVLLPIRFVGIEGLAAGQAGLWMMALSLPLVALPLVAGVLARHFPPASICGAGLLVSAAGLVWLGLDGEGLAALPPMLLIGIGMSMPWGLMDGLAVSVVPKERAGMATGIFSTTRVAGEGLALAIVSAVLSALIAHRLAADPGTPREALAALAQGLVSGDLGVGDRLALRQPSVAALTQAYQGAFATLMLILAGMSTLTAAVVFVFLGRGLEADETEAGDPAGLTPGEPPRGPAATVN